MNSSIQLVCILFFRQLKIGYKTGQRKNLLNSSCSGVNICYAFGDAGKIISYTYATSAGSITNNLQFHSN